ncbi:MAG TPA: hypothetical protein VH643_21930 [Gemmataceae bacterium]|jgi:hypothetical protein
MKIHRGIIVLLLTLFASGRSISGEAPCCEPPGESILQRFHPVGGWHPYGGGLLHWWPQHCFPCGGGPDDYCRKPLPRVCWPPYPSYYIWGPPVCPTPCKSGPACSQRH